MTKAAVKAMDTITDFVNKTIGQVVDQYCVGGASKVSHKIILVPIYQSRIKSDVDLSELKVNRIGTGFKKILQTILRINLKHRVFYEQQTRNNCNNVSIDNSV